MVIFDNFQLEGVNLRGKHRVLINDTFQVRRIDFCPIESDGRVVAPIDKQQRGRELYRETSAESEIPLFSKTRDREQKVKTPPASRRL